MAEQVIPVKARIEEAAASPDFRAEGVSARDFQEKSARGETIKVFFFEASPAYTQAQVQVTSSQNPAITLGIAGINTTFQPFSASARQLAISNSFGPWAKAAKIEWKNF